MMHQVNTSPRGVLDTQTRELAVLRLRDPPVVVTEPPEACCFRMRVSTVRETSLAI